MDRRDPYIEALRRTADYVSNWSWPYAGDSHLLRQLAEALKAGRLMWQLETDGERMYFDPQPHRADIFVPVLVIELPDISGEAKGESG